MPDSPQHSEQRWLRGFCWSELRRSNVGTVRRFDCSPRKPLNTKRVKQEKMEQHLTHHPWPLCIVWLISSNNPPVSYPPSWTPTQLPVLRVHTGKVERRVVRSSGSQPHCKPDEETSSNAKTHQKERVFYQIDHIIHSVSSPFPSTSW